MIRKLNKSIHEAKDKIELLFNKLATLTDDLEKKNKGI